ncbi:MAG: hypothetical protein KGY39_02225 [Anaerolineales bacterium]|nr:hypothetical protein [Anaerolineales bacterium]MBS3752973.1 hypothetical protein [Anaerolineales bacterium]
MKKKLFIFVILILFALTACDNSLQKATQQVLGKEERSTPTPPPTEEENEAEQSEEEKNTSTCPEADPQPIAVSISEKFDVSYEKVIDWYCDGYIFEDILLALQTSKMSDVEPDTLLEEIKEKTWEEIWDNLGITNPQE